MRRLLLALSAASLACSTPARPRSPLAPPETTVGEAPATAASVTTSPPPTATAAAATATASGAPAADARVPNVANVVATMSRDFRACFERGLVKAPDMKGQIAVHVTIGSGGEVKSIASDPKGISAEVVTCVESRIRIAQFAPPEGGPQATIVLPLSFVGEPAPVEDDPLGKKKKPKKP